MPDWVKWALWGGGTLILILIVTPWFLEAWSNRDELKPDETGATEEWATGELAVIVEEVSFDRELGNTTEVDMADLRTKLELEDVEIAIKKRSNEVLGTIIHTLTDDKAWQKRMAATKYKGK